MNYEKIGEFIAKKRKEKDMTQKELAIKIGVTDKAISKWERGLGCPDVSILEILSKALDVSILEILKGRIIENKVIPVTEVNDYILETVDYSKELNHNKIKLFISNLIAIIIFSICSFLLIININHILYLNRDITNTLSTSHITEIKDDIESIKKNIDIIYNNQGKYSDEDYETLKDNLSNMNQQMENMKILKYDSHQKITVNDLHMIDMSIPSGVLILNSYTILKNYSETIDNYSKLYEYSYISHLFSEVDSIYSTYKYQLIDNLNEMFISDTDMSTRVYETLYFEKQLLTLTKNIIEVGEING